MLLADRVSVSRRFQRAIRIDTDYGDPTALDGFHCPRSCAVILETMAHHVSETGQGAFTWTGPYGSGKSSLAVALASLLNGNGAMRQVAANVIGRDTADLVWDALPPKVDGWRVLPIVGRRERPEILVGEALASSRFPKVRRRRKWTEKQVLDTVTELAQRDPETSGGLIILVDEMGKLLEGVSRDGSDVYFFQQIAELASRSAGRLLFVGVLHQAFEEYSYRLARETRDEWSKIQGRFVDLPVNVGADEQLALLGQAIDPGDRPRSQDSLAAAVAALVNRPASEDLADLLEACWPLHPVVAVLLGPISRRRFGQNQRSIFGFLNSGEPGGFQDFLRQTADNSLYTTHMLWEYLRFNLEPTIMASPDGHRWATAVDALERCHAQGGDDLHRHILEAIALVDLFRERSGLAPSLNLLETIFPDVDSDRLEGALAQLEKWSLVISRRFNDSYSIFEGSDFDVDEAVGLVLEPMEQVDFDGLNAIADLHPLVAKRHYNKTGALRWYDLTMGSLSDLQRNPERYRSNRGEAGTFVLAIPRLQESLESASGAVRDIVRQVDDWDLVVGLPQRQWDFTSLIRELVATERVRDESPVLQGDRVARREVEARINNLRSYIESELSAALDEARWFDRRGVGEVMDRVQLNGFASDLADLRFQESPRIHNELLNRVKPSSNAVAAQNALLRRMAQNEGEQRLGISGFPAEGGLYASLLESTRLYCDTGQGWRFLAPVAGPGDPSNLAPVWSAAVQHLGFHRDRAVPLSEVYDIWREPPFGIKEGLLSVLSTAFILSQRSRVAVYRQNVFQARLTDLDVDYLARDAADIQLRWMDLTETARELLSDMADVVRVLDPGNKLPDLEPIDVAKGLVSIYDRLVPWVGRTQRLSGNARQVRQLFKQASDPNRLIFDQIPQSLSDGLDLSEEGSLKAISSNVRQGLEELQDAYPTLLRRLSDTLLGELQVPNTSVPMLAELRTRAENVRDLSGDHRMEAFIMRLAQYHGTDEDMESLASMAANKPTGIWVDADVARAELELAEIAQRFVRIESFAHVMGRSDRRHAMAVTVGLSGRPSTFQDVFEVTSLERGEVDSLVAGMKQLLQGAGPERRNIVLAALAELSAMYIDQTGHQDE